MSRRFEIEQEARGWIERRRCRDKPVEFFYPGTSVSAVRLAQAFCRGCQVVTECLDHALATGEEHGVWGATTERDRRRIRRQRRLDRVA